MSEKTYKEVELLIEFQGAGIVTGLFEDAGDSFSASIRHNFAEVNIPYHTDTEIYCFICFLVGVPRQQPAVTEMMALNDIKQQLYRDFGQYAETPDWDGKPH